MITEKDQQIEEDVFKSFKERTPYINDIIQETIKKTKEAYGELK